MDRAKDIEPLLTMKELCGKLKLTRRGVGLLLNRRAIPVIRMGRNLRFRWNEVEAALSRMTVRAV